MYTFEKKENRDKVYRKLKELGYRVSRGSIRNQLLHPEYVAEYRNMLTEAEKGFGNTLYRTHFAALYDVYFEAGTLKPSCEEYERVIKPLIEIPERQF
jgi:hypothetical protein